MSSHSHNPIFDSLYCTEERFDEDFGSGFVFTELEIENSDEIQPKLGSFMSEHDLFWEEQEVENLLVKEKKQAAPSYEGDLDGSLRKLRNEGVKWMLKVIARYGFTAMTAVLAVNYYDRFLTSDCFKKETPWMGQLAAVACLSVATKVEEIEVPLLLEFQVEESKYVFEAKTIMRMEILVLSTLEWKMNPVTAISFFDHFVRRFDLLANLHWDFLRRCESVIMSIITDCKHLNYLPSVIAAATMVYVIGEIEPSDSLDIKNQAMSILTTNKEKLDDCLKLIVEVIDNQSRRHNHKRIHESIPSSPSGVIDSYFCSESSNDSWSAAISVSSSPESLFKRRRVKEQYMSPLRSSMFWCG